MKRNQVIAAMQALPEDCDIEFSVMPREKMVDITSAQSNFIFLACKTLKKDYEISDWPFALFDVFSELGQGDQAKAVLMSTAVDFNRREQAIDAAAFESLAKLAMR